MSMHREEGPPPIQERYRMPMRIAVIVAAYVLYRVLSPTSTPGAAFLGVGLGLIGLALVDRWTVWRRDRSGLLQVGTTLLGVGLASLGLYFLFG